MNSSFSPWAELPLSSGHNYFPLEIIQNILHSSVLLLWSNTQSKICFSVSLLVLPILIINLSIACLSLWDIYFLCFTFYNIIVYAWHYQLISKTKYLPFRLPNESLRVCHCQALYWCWKYKDDQDMGLQRTQNPGSFCGDGLKSFFLFLKWWLYHPFS